ncbi:MAG: polysaccharide biosynthesis/export family protein [Cytophagaceae bacterium]|nr:polysaccharide biosynthesis/export family protein [Cytophagaceae bacterium]MDW8456907.1 polysaccharide biosynthesis/export family protein [Cytophagaceae bacterium]
MNKIIKTDVLFIIVTTACVLLSCRVYRQNIMFRTDEQILIDSIQKADANHKKNYVIQKNDYISIKVYTNNGERIIDPDYELLKATGIQAGTLNRETPKYLVRDNGMVFLPMIGDIKLEGYTLRQADSILSEAYSKFYYNVYVITKFENKRVVVLGALGGKVLNLENENTNLIEVIAQYGGVSQESKAHNIRVIRGDLKNPQVTIIDLSTIEGMKKATLNVEPNDIIYIEPQRRILPQTIQDLSPIISLVLSILTFIALLTSLRK